MGRDAIHAAVQEDAKKQIVKCVKPVMGERGSLTGFLENLAEKLKPELARISDEAGQIPESDLVVKLVPRKKK